LIPTKEKDPSEEGFFISYEDFESLIARLEALEREIKPLRLNRDGLPMRIDNVGLAAAMDKDGITSVHDKIMPDSADFMHESGEMRPFDLLESRDYHERIEDANMQAGHDYYEAHRVATEAEHSRMRQLGFDPNEVEAFQKPYIDAAAHEARAKGNTTPEIGNEPYRVSEETEMRADNDDSDNRYVLDIDGRKYDRPVMDKLLGTCEIVTGCNDNKWAAIDINSGKVLTTAESRRGAIRKVEAWAKNLGRRRLKARFESYDQMSQQQLRAKFEEPLRT